MFRMPTILAGCLALVVFVCMIFVPNEKFNYVELCLTIIIFMLGLVIAVVDDLLINYKDFNKNKE